MNFTSKLGINVEVTMSKGRYTFWCVSAGVDGALARDKGMLRLKKMQEMSDVTGIRDAARRPGILRETWCQYGSAEEAPALKAGNRWRFKKTILDG